MRRVFVSALALTVLLALVAVTLAFAVAAMLAGQNCGSGTPTVSAPLASPQTAGEMVRYLESQGVSAFGAAGIVGNLEQESGLNPIEPGGGLAQWDPGWWAEMVGYDRSVGQNPDTVAGQLMYIASELHSAYSSLLAKLNAATSPQEAAIEWQNDYEHCQGAGPSGTLSFDPSGLCMTDQREGYAVAALQAAGAGTAGSTQLVSYTPGQACNAAYALSRLDRRLHQSVLCRAGPVVGANRSGRRRVHAVRLAAARSGSLKVRSDRSGLLRRRARDGHADPQRSPRRQGLVLVRADNADDQCGTDGQRRANGGDVRAQRNLHRNRLVGDRGGPAARRRRGLHRGLQHPVRRGLPLPAQGARREPGNGRGLLDCAPHHDRHLLLPAATVLRRMTCVDIC